MSKFEHIGWLMIQIERVEPDSIAGRYHRQFVEELETRLHEAAEDGCNGNHPFHETSCHACYLIRRGEFCGIKIKSEARL